MFARERVGCAVFEGAISIDGPGYASINGGKVERFESIDLLTEKHPEVIWVTSVSTANFLSGAGGRKPLLRSGNFFETSVASLIDEIGARQELPWDAARYISEIVSRTFYVASQFCDITFPGESNQRFSDLLQMFVAPNLSRDMNLPEVGMALAKLVATPVATISSATGTQIVIDVPMQRVAHMLGVMSTPVPTGDWHRVNLAGINDQYKWICEKKSPVLAEVRITKSQSNLGGLVNKGVIGGAPIWLAHPELIELGKHAEFNVHNVFIADDYFPAEATLASPTPAFEAQDHASISSGLFAEAFLMACCNQPQVSEFPSVSVSPRAAWLMSSARSRVLAQAAMFVREGFNVLSYGPLSFRLALKQNDLPRFRQCISKSQEVLMPARYSSRWKGRN